jgi:carboxymethylenebutenolidase
MKTTSERITIPVGNHKMGAYVARPEGAGAYPAVLLFMEIFGINAHIRSVADRVAAEGYVVLAPDLFHRDAPGIELGYDQASLTQGIEIMVKTRPDGILADVTAAHMALTKRPDVKGRGVGAIGFCFGGHVAYRTACELPLVATASFYGGGIAAPAAPATGPSTLERTSAMKGRILCLFGENDGYIPAADVAAIRKALAAAKVRHEVIVYPGVGHGFFCDVRGDYDAKSAADAWERVKKLFREELA